MRGSQNEGVGANGRPGSDRALLNVGAVFLLETKRKFPGIFAQARNAQLVQHCLSGAKIRSCHELTVPGLLRLSQENSDALSAEEITELRAFLSSAASKL